MNRKTRLQIRRALLLAAMLSVAASCRQEPEQPGLFIPYRGRFAGDRRLTSLRQTIAAAIPRAGARVGRAYGRQVNPLAYRYRLLDWRVAPGGDVPRGRTIFFEDGAPPQIELHIEPLLFGIADPTSTIAHEIAHAALYERLGRRHSQLPVWLREGLCTFAAGQRNEKVRAALAWSERGIDGLVDGLEREPHRWTDYAEDVLAIEALRLHGGAEAIPRLIDALAAGEDPRTAIERLTKMSWFDFQTRAAEHARTVMTDTEGGTGATLRLARARFRSRSHEAVVAILTPVQSARESVHQAPALYFSARSRIALGDFRGAAEALHRLLSQHRRDLRYFKHALEASALANRQLGRKFEAEAAEKELLAYDPSWGRITSVSDRIVNSGCPATPAQRSSQREAG